jgi:Na+/H+ antiporter NhaA
MKIAVLTGSFIASVLGALLLRRRAKAQSDAAVE